MKKTLKLFGIFGLLMVFALAVVGCPDDVDDADDISTVKQLSDSRFKGTFVYTDQYQYLGKSTENRLTFDGTNKVKEKLIDRDKDGKTTDTTNFEWEIEIIADAENEYKEQYRKKLWNNEYSTWSDWNNYQFDSSGQQLTITGWWTSATFVYTKQ